MTSAQHRAEKTNKIQGNMKSRRLTVLSLIALTGVPLLAQAQPLLGGDLNQVTVFSRTYFTAGENTKVYGNVLSGGVGSTGAGSAIQGYFESAGAANIGASIVGGSQTTTSVSGYLKSGDLVTTGDGSIVKGDVTASGAANIGANAKVGGYVISGGVGTAGANAIISGNFSSLGANSIGDSAQVGRTFSSGGLASVGANAKVGGNVLAGGAASISGSSNITGNVFAVKPSVGQSSLSASPVSPTITSSVTADVIAHVQKDAEFLRIAQASLSALPNSTAAIMGNDTLHSVITSALPATMTVDTTLHAGVYSAPSWSTTAGTTLTLDGQGKNNQSWVFNFNDILAFGGTSHVVLKNVGVGDSVVWNVNNNALNGYASIGDGASVVGTIIANTYVSVGANASVLDVGSTCGGVYSQTSYVSTGANSIIGGSGCSVTSAVPEPATYSMLLAGLGMLVTVIMRRKKTDVG